MTTGVAWEGLPQPAAQDGGGLPLWAAAPVVTEVRKGEVVTEKKLPEGWRTATIGELLPEEGIEPVRRVLEDLKNRVVVGQEAHKKLIEVLEPYRKHLESKEILVEYLAYALESSVITGAV